MDLRFCPFVRCFGGYAATHLKGTGAAPGALCYPHLHTVGRRDRLRIGAMCPFVRLVSGVATTSLATGLGLIPFGRLHVFPSLLPPTAVLSSVSCVEAAMTPYKDVCLEPGPSTPTPTVPPSPAPPTPSKSPTPMPRGSISAKLSTGWPCPRGAPPTRPPFRHLHRRPRCPGRLAHRLWRHHRRHGIHRGLLDSLV